MRLLNITDIATPYPSYLPRFLRANPALGQQSYSDQHQVVDHDHFVWAMPFNQAMGAYGYEVMNVDRSILSMQHAWAVEHGHDPHRMAPDDIVLAQARAFKPEVMVYDLSDPVLLRRLRREIPSVRLVLGWVGSPMTLGKTWGDIDLLMTCAPESVVRLSAMGVHARHVNHSFDPVINDRLVPTARRIRRSFIGSIVRRSEFHLARERLLLEFAHRSTIDIFSPTIDVRPRDYAKAAAAGTAYVIIGVLRRTGVLRTLRSASIVQRAERIASPPRLPVNRKLARHVRAGVYGLEYFQTLKDSDVSLNIHADTSPTHASNMRLFEATGVGSCLLTDWKPNMAELYEPDTEVVVYRSPAEALEKAQWLEAHPDARQRIATAGMKRTLRDHTFASRAGQIDSIIRDELRRRHM